MPVIMDLECNQCGAEYIDGLSSDLDSKCECGGRLVWLPSLRTVESPMPFSNSDKCVVYVSEKEGGKVQYPGRNDVPVPDRLVQRGYVRHEMNPRQLRAFEKTHNVVNERTNYDSNGNGI